MLWRHPFSETPALAGELLHIPERIPTFVATVLLSLAGDILYGVWVLASCRALKQHFRIIPHRQYCLPVMAHKEPLLRKVPYFFNLNHTFSNCQNVLSDKIRTVPHWESRPHIQRGPNVITSVGYLHPNSDHFGNNSRSQGRYTF